MLPDRTVPTRSAPPSATATATVSPGHKPADTTREADAPAGQSGPRRALAGPLSNLPPDTPALRHMAGRDHDAGTGGPTSRVRRWAANLAGFFCAPSDASEARANALRKWRPTQPALQHFHELIDSIAQAPDGDRAAIANALEARLRDAGLILPPHLHSAALTIRTLLSPGWFDAVCNQAVNISDLLSALRRSDEVEPDAQPELRRRLVTSFEVEVHRLAESHAGVAALRDSCKTAPRPLQEAPSRQADAGSRMRTFSSSVALMVKEPELRNATAGALAARLHDCLRQNRNWSEEEEISLGKQIAPAIEALIHADTAARRLAKPLREAAARLESHLNISAGLDLTEPKKRGDGLTPLERMEPRSARGFLFSGLLRCALDPAVLNAHLREGALREWLHPVVVEHPERQRNGRVALEVLRQTLRPLLDTGLIDHDQRHALMQQLEDHLRLE